LHTVIFYYILHTAAILFLGFQIYFSLAGYSADKFFLRSKYKFN